MTTNKGKIVGGKYFNWNKQQKYFNKVRKNIQNVEMLLFNLMEKETQF